jgi:hypothetical protein
MSLMAEADALNVIRVAELYVTFSPSLVQDRVERAVGVHSPGAVTDARHTPVSNVVAGILFAAWTGWNVTVTLLVSCQPPFRLSLSSIDVPLPLDRPPLTTQSFHAHSRPVRAVRRCRHRSRRCQRCRRWNRNACAASLDTVANAAFDLVAAVVAI